MNLEILIIRSVLLIWKGTRYHLGVEKLRVLNVSSGDLIGSRFNGYDWHDNLLNFGVETSMLVHWNHISTFDWVDQLENFNKGDRAESAIRKRYQLNQYQGDETANLPWSSNIFNHPFYKSADVIHLQIVHDGTLDFHTIGRIMKEKPTVWTWHDPWPLTGHCVYPMNCSRWEKGCGHCPDLVRPFRVGRDKTKENRISKENLIAGKYSLHVSTNWFADLIAAKEITNLPKPIVIPFGINSQQFTKIDKSQARKKLGIPKESFVVGIRATFEKQKNYKSFLNAMDLMPKIKNMTILTLQEINTLAKNTSKFNVIDLGWTNDNLELAEFFAAIDLFIMPSEYETFGFMSIEAMSTGTPVLAIGGTAIDEICDLKQNGYSLIDGSPAEIVKSLLQIHDNQNELRVRGEKSQNHIKRNFDMNVFCKELVELYHSTKEDFNRK